jgi:glycyl-tRNA synthetase
MPEFAHKLAEDLRRRFPVYYDESGSIGRRYRRQDEVGTPYCLTIDGQTMTDGTVTIRGRDDLKQVRIAADQVASRLHELLAADRPHARIEDLLG